MIGLKVIQRRDFSHDKTRPRRAARMDYVAAYHAGLVRQRIRMRSGKCDFICVTGHALKSESLPAITKITSDLDALAPIFEPYNIGGIFGVDLIRLRSESERRAASGQLRAPSGKPKRNRLTIKSNPQSTSLTKLLYGLNSSHRLASDLDWSAPSRQDLDFYNAVIEHHFCCPSGCFPLGIHFKVGRECHGENAEVDQRARDIIPTGQNGVYASSLKILKLELDVFKTVLFTCQVDNGIKKGRDTVQRHPLVGLQEERQLVALKALGQSRHRHRIFPLLTNGFPPAESPVRGQV